MTNLAGRTLSHYRLEAKIGAGGMGEVYRGVDTRLDRQVAVKILPRDLLADEERRRRFTQEAKAASALNHPNIVTIHDVGSDAGIDLMVMEYVEGQTLEHRIGRRPMPLGTLLKDAVQIADALTAAHAAGIVHRDLKPANVMVTSQGWSKCWTSDWRSWPGSPPRASDRTSRHGRPARQPSEGTVIGTAAYMSPEQAQGGVVDARSDIFSFGAVLYEMATGRRAFSGLHGDVHDRVGAARRSAEGEHGERRAAAARPRDRHQPRAEEGSEPALPAHGRSEGRARGSEGGIGVGPVDDGRDGVGAAEAPAALDRRRCRRTSHGGRRLRLARVGQLSGRSQTRALTRMTFDTGATRSPAVSPDGKLIAFVSDRTTPLPNLWIQQVDGGQAVQLTHHEGGADSPSFSPDGTRIAYVGMGKDEGVYVIPTIGGDPKKIAARGSSPQFSPDGSQVAYWTTEAATRRASWLGPRAANRRR